MTADQPSQVFPKTTLSTNFTSVVRWCRRDDTFANEVSVTAVVVLLTPLAPVAAGNPVAVYVQPFAGCLQTSSHPSLALYGPVFRGLQPTLEEHSSDEHTAMSWPGEVDAERPEFGDAAGPRSERSDEACGEVRVYFETLGVGLGIGLGGGFAFVLLLLLGCSKTHGVQRRPAEAARLIWALGAASFVALLAILTTGHPDDYVCSRRGAYALAAAAVTLAVAAVLLLLDRFKPAALHAELARGATTLTLVAALSCAWWAAGAGVLTFYGPFKATSNGYFASWAALVASLKLFGAACRPAARAATDAENGADAAAGADADAENSADAAADPAFKPLVGLLACSLVVVVASALELQNPTKGGIATGALVASACSAHVVALLLFLPSLVSGRRRTLLLGALFVAWASVVYFATRLSPLSGTGNGPVYGPFSSTGNGYFGAWGGLLCATLALMHEGSDPAGVSGPLPCQLATEARLLLGCVGLASFVLFLDAQSCAGQCLPRPAYALAAAGVALSVVLVLHMHHALKPGDADACLGAAACSFNSGGGTGSGGVWRVEACVALFLSAWWAAAAAVLTFSPGPYVATGNPYFAIWAALLCSLLLLASTKKVEVGGVFRSRNTKALLGLLAGSAVLLFACLDHLKAAPEAVYGLVCGAITPLPAVLMLLVPDKVPPIVHTLTCALFVLVWLAAVGACTFSRPFVQTGNGYFACWLGLLCTVTLAAEVSK